jgi:hypothetical protein
MGKAFLMSVVIVPVLLGMHAANSRGLRRGFWRVIVSVLVFDILYLVALYVLRRRWI